MVFHILANAIKFNKEINGKIEIILSYESKSENGYLKCLICDTGQGMTKKQIEQSLEAFGNINLRKESNEDFGPSANVMTTSGIGLGISTSYKLAKAMKGNLVITSKKSDEAEDGQSGT
jgi:signal transduction histidine kinase